MEALVNDPNTNQMDILLIQETPTSTCKTFVQHRQWHLYQPTYSDTTKRTRSLIYINKRLSPASHRQITCDSADAIAVKIQTPTNQVIIFSVYTPPVDLGGTANGTELQPTLDAIDQTIQSATTGANNETKIIMGGDFNRHHPAWGNNRIHRDRVGEGEELLAFMEAQGLQNCVARNTPTYWSQSWPGTTSTLDLTLTNMPELLLKCHLYGDSYGSDHRAILSEWDIHPDLRNNSQPRLQYERTDWGKAGQQIQRNANIPARIRSKEDLDQVAKGFIDTVSTAIKDHTPLAKPSPYAKRWFNPDLKKQQIELNKTRRKWQSSCATKGKDDPVTMHLFGEMRLKRRKWTRDIEKAKRRHWREFLGQANSDTFLWKAARYAEPTDRYATIPPLKVDDTEYTSNEDKARVFMDSFFPQSQVTTESGSRRKRDPLELPWAPISESEIARVMATAKGKSAPGIDDLPMLVWKNIWKYTSKTILQIFESSIELGYYPAAWKTASIVILRKLTGKRDYTSPDAYRPISLLNTLGKLLEGVIARRLSYYAEKYKLLPDTQFGGRPGRSTEQALLILANAIDVALRKHRVLTLVSFDLKGAFNRVNKYPLNARLREKGIPTAARRWIMSFMEERKASIQFDGFRTAIQDMPQGVLAQGSPLSPILFDFFTSNLVDQAVNYFGGASAFIDDYFRWRVSNTAEGNLNKIQNEDIPRLEEWARRNGAEFDAEKTKLIHFTRKKKEQLKGSITMNGATKEAQPAIKLLGVIFDQEVRWKEHAQYAMKKATKTNLALARLRFLRPKQARELYQACVIPKLDYASTVWYNPQKSNWHTKALDTVQRVAILRTLAAFQTVATESLQAETYTLPTRLRLRLRAHNIITRLRTLPETHPIHKVLERVTKRISSKGNGPQHPLLESMKTMNREQMEPVETIDPYLKEPWRRSVFEHIDLEPESGRAKEIAHSIESDPSLAVFTDGSGIGGNLGAAAVMLDSNGNARKANQVGVGSSQHWAIHHAELIAIKQGVDLAVEEQQQNGHTEGQCPRTCTILSDSRSALQALDDPPKRSGQNIVNRITESVLQAKDHLMNFRLKWIPGHRGILGNETADHLAKAAVKLPVTHDFPKPASLRFKYNRTLAHERWKSEWSSSDKGHPLRQLDSALPGRHVRHLYDKLPRRLSYFLAQLRTCHSWLATHGKRLKKREDDKCECGGKETTKHVLIDCPRLQTARQKLRKKIGPRFNSISLMLGGKPRDEGDGEGKKWTISKRDLEAVLEFAEESQRFNSRVTGEESTQSTTSTTSTGRRNLRRTH